MPSLIPCSPCGAEGIRDGNRKVFGAHFKKRPAGGTLNSYKKAPPSIAEGWGFLCAGLLHCGPMQCAMGGLSPPGESSQGNIDQSGLSPKHHLTKVNCFFYVQECLLALCLNEARLVTKPAAPYCKGLYIFIT